MRVMAKPKRPSTRENASKKETAAFAVDARDKFKRTDCVPLTTCAPVDLGSATTAFAA